MTHNYGIHYDGIWFFFEDDEDAEQARNIIASSLSPLSGDSPRGVWIDVIDQQGTPFQLLVSPGVPVIFRGARD